MAEALVRVDRCIGRSVGGRSHAAQGLGARDAAAVFDVAAQPHEHVGCVLCGTGPTAIVATTDRYGLPVRTVQCLRCGLQFINPRMTAAGYAAFYQDGYRRLLTHLFQRPYTAASLVPDQQRYAKDLAREVGRWMPQGGSFLDVGGSTGIVARTFLQQFGGTATVIDPALEELQRAEGCIQIHASAEDDVPWPSVDVALLCRTVEHLRNPLAVLRRLRAHARVLVVDAMNVPRWPKGWQYKVDHPYAFTGTTLRRLVDAAGWRPVHVWDRRNRQYIGLVCSPQE